MCTGRCARCLGISLLPLALTCTLANAFLLFPNFEYRYIIEGNVSRHAWVMSGLWGGGFMVFIAAKSFMSTSSKTGCCEFRTEMLCSTLYSAVALTGSTLCFMICCTGLVKGPLCAYKVTFSNKSQGLEWGYPLEQFSTREVNYLYNRTSWFTVCVEPHNVVIWNVVLFCILLALSGAEALLCVVQILNGITGCVFGPDVRNNKVGPV
ncbi:transmembrane 4 L6 family member 5-like isoform X1 [Acipenser oxyrinchus oxyrinchus]|uniref:Transmembrane 4 L6 family member 5-like isoform X1 n=1 Tax=Acipenser oxyrinchus oxyrinchus TaxID=40147 RepID=A0AAD8G4P0_ACIOX|nr:transmembrane 4 L6 family member 5-like isoform X1 [Acipenser oxyrinchus oxyrinchus]